MAGNAPHIPGCHDLSLIGERVARSLFSATSDRVGRPVTVTVFPPLSDGRTREGFDRAAATAQRLGAHPSVVTIHEWGHAPDGRPWIVTEPQPAESVDTLLTMDGPLDVERALRVGVLLAGALETAHRAGILHGDLSPARLVFGPHGEPLLAETGLAEFAVFPGLGALNNPVRYHAPPEVLERTEISPATDVYSLATTVYALLAGRAPQQKPAEMTDSNASLLLRILQMPVPPIDRPDLPAGLQKALRGPLSASPSKRPQQAIEVAWLLQDVQRRSGFAVTEPVVLDLDDLAAGTHGAAPGWPATPPGSTAPTDAVPPPDARPPTAWPLAEGLDTLPATDAPRPGGPAPGAPGAPAESLWAPASSADPPAGSLWPPAPPVESPGPVWPTHPPADDPPESLWPEPAPTRDPATPEWPAQPADDPPQSPWPEPAPTCDPAMPQWPARAADDPPQSPWAGPAPTTEPPAEPLWPAQPPADQAPSSLWPSTWPADQPSAEMPAWASPPAGGESAPEPDRDADGDDGGSIGDLGGRPPELDELPAWYTDPLPNAGGRPSANGNGLGAADGPSNPAAPWQDDGLGNEHTNGHGLLPFGTAGAGNEPSPGGGPAGGWTPPIERPPAPRRLPGAGDELRSLFGQVVGDAGVPGPPGPLAPEPGPFGPPQDRPPIDLSHFDTPIGPAPYPPGTSDRRDSFPPSPPTARDRGVGAPRALGAADGWRRADSDGRATTARAPRPGRSAPRQVAPVADRPRDAGSSITATAGPPALPLMVLIGVVAVLILGVAWLVITGDDAETPASDRSPANAEADAGEAPTGVQVSQVPEGIRVTWTGASDGSYVVTVLSPDQPPMALPATTGTSALVPNVQLGSGGGWCVTVAMAADPQEASTPACTPGASLDGMRTT